MSDLALSLFRGWWARLFSRAAVARSLENADLQRPAGGVAAESAGPEGAAGDRAEANRRQPARTEARIAARVVAQQSLAETLRVAAVPPPAPGRPADGDPRARARTLAALKDLQQIPALQSLAQGFTQALNQPDVVVDELVTAISKDSGLCVRVLRMANSVLVSPERRIDDLHTAVQMLGIRRVRQAAQALFTLRDANRVTDGFDWRHLWIHAIATASISEELEGRLRAARDPQLHLAALLHDVGKIVLSTIAPDDYREVLVAAWNEQGRLEDLESCRIGVHHREAGLSFAQRSGMPAMVLEAIAHHDRPDEAQSHRFEVALVALANHLSKAHGLGFSGARLEERDGEFDELPAWEIIATETGARPDAAEIEADLEAYLSELRAELRELHTRP